MYNGARLESYYYVYLHNIQYGVLFKPYKLFSIVKYVFRSDFGIPTMIELFNCICANT